MTFFNLISSSKMPEPKTYNDPSKTDEHHSILRMCRRSFYRR